MVAAESSTSTYGNGKKSTTTVPGSAAAGGKADAPAGTLQDGGHTASSGLVAVMVLRQLCKSVGS